MIKISFIGDITCDRPFLQAANKDGKYDFSGAFGKVSNLITTSDYAVGNLETTFCSEKIPYNKGMHYNTPDSFIDEIKRTGIKLLTTANNHCFDGGMDGLIRTRRFVISKGFDITGTYENNEKKRYFIKKFGEVKVAFFSYTYSVNRYPEIKIPENLSKCVNLLRSCKNIPLKDRIIDRLFPYSLRRKIKILLKKPTITTYTDKLHPELIDKEYLSRISDEIKEAKSEADIVVFCLHIGGQFNETPGDYSEYIMKFLKEQGVDVVIGHHPHTIQKTEVENGKVFAYSLGGFNLSPSAIYINHTCKPEYSQLINIYIDEKSKKIVKCGFSFVKVLEDDNAFISVVPVNDLFSLLEEDEKEVLLEDIKSLYKRVTGAYNDIDATSKEYILFDLSDK